MLLSQVKLKEMNIVENKILFDDPNLSMMQLDDWYTYAHMSRTQEAEDGSGQGVAVLVYTLTDEGKLDKILGRYENCLPHKSEADGLTSITGGVDKGSSIIDSVLNELNEEAGYEDIDPGKLQDLGSCRPSKQEDSVWNLYAFDATGLERREDSVGDGTKGEEDAYCEWVEPHMALGCKCPLVPTMFIRAGLGDLV